MFGNLVGTPPVVCVEDRARDPELAPLEPDGYWAYTPDGDVYVSNTRLALRNSDDSSALADDWVETCF